jgi:hypothetical protein
MPIASAVIADMKGNDIALPGISAGTSYAKGGFVVMGGDWRGQSTPTWWNSSNKFYGYWNAAIPWFVIWDGQGHQSGLNTRVLVFDIELYVLRMDNVWERINFAKTPGGEAFQRNLVSASGGADARNEGAGGLSVRVQPGGNVYHGWGGMVGFQGSNVKGVHSRIKFALIKHDVNGVDDRHLARYAVTVGADAYVYSGQRVTEFGPANYNPGLGGSKFKLATNEVQEVCFTTLSSALGVDYSANGGKDTSRFVMSDSAFLANLPPGVTLAGSPPSVPAPTPTPPPVSAPTVTGFGPNRPLTTADRRRLSIIGPNEIIVGAPEFPWGPTDGGNAGGYINDEYAGGFTNADGQFRIQPWWVLCASANRNPVWDLVTPQVRNMRVYVLRSGSWVKVYETPNPAIGTLWEYQFAYGLSNGRPIPDGRQPVTVPSGGAQVDMAYDWAPHGYPMTSVGGTMVTPDYGTDTAIYIEMEARLTPKTFAGGGFRWADSTLGMNAGSDNYQIHWMGEHAHGAFFRLTNMWQGIFSASVKRPNGTGWGDKPSQGPGLTDSAFMANQPPLPSSVNLWLEKGSYSGGVQRLALRRSAPATSARTYNIRVDYGTCSPPVEVTIPAGQDYVMFSSAGGSGQQCLYIYTLTSPAEDVWDTYTPGVGPLSESTVPAPTPTPPPSPTPTPPAPTPPAPTPTTPPPAPVGRKELWLSGSAQNSVQDGTRANPINSGTILRQALTTYGPTGADLRMMENGVWSGVFPDDAFFYNGTTIKGNDWVSDIGYFEGGVRRADWAQISGAPGGKQLWKCTSITNQPVGTSLLQAGAVSIDDTIIAHRHFTTLGPTVTAMDAFTSAYTFDAATNSLYLLLPTGVNPNSLVTMIAQWAECFRNFDFAAGGNKRSGIVMSDLRFKRYSGVAVNLANLPGVQARRFYGKHIGGRYNSTPVGKFFELYGGCDSFIVEDVRADGVQESVLSIQVRAGLLAQNNGTIRRITGTHTGDAVVEVSTQIANGGAIDNLLVEDANGTLIGRYRLDGLRPDAPGRGVVFVSNPNPGTSRIENAIIRRAMAVDCPMGLVEFGDTSAGRTILLEACQGRTGISVPVDYGFSVRHSYSGTGTDSFQFRACAFEGYNRGVRHDGGVHTFAIEATNCVFVDMGTAGIDLAGRQNTTLTIQNNVAHDSVALVAGLGGGGVSVTNNGGNYVSSGTSLGVTAVGTDDVAAADPGFVGASVGKPPNASALYSGGTALSITLDDRLGQTFESPWAQGAYAQYTASDASATGSPSTPGPTGTDGVWEDKYTPDGDLAFVAGGTQPPGSSITGMTNVPTTLNLTINEAYTFSPLVTGTGQYSGAVTYSIVSGTVVTITSTGVLRATAIGQARAKITSLQNPSVFREVDITVQNYTEKPIYADPESLALTLVGGPGSVKILSEGVPQAGLTVTSGNSQILSVEEKTRINGDMVATPLAVGSTTVLVTKTSRSDTGVMTIQVPVTVTEGVASGEVTTIDPGGDYTIYINQSPYYIQLRDQHGQPLTDPAKEIEVTVSKPGYVAAPHVVNGVLPVYPKGVGIATITLALKDPAPGKIESSFTVEVLPIGGSPTPPPSPPPISPPSPDTTPPGDFIFEVDAE